MAQITAALVKELREISGAGMMDCKKALGETDGEFEAAIDWLRKKGLSAAAKKSGRVAAEGLVAVTVNQTLGSVIEVNAETDFVGRNEKFQEFVSNLATIALSSQANIESLPHEAYPEGGRTVGAQLTHLVATIGENLNLRRISHLQVSEGVVTSYTHGAVASNLGRICVLVALESSGDTAKLHELGKQIAMHIAAARPEALKREDIDASRLDREREILADQARASGKPEEIVQKMVEGRLRKFYEDVVLLEQTWVLDNESKVVDVLKSAEGDVGAPITLSGFERFELGDGIDRKEDDFAAEVEALAKS